MAVNNVARNFVNIASKKGALPTRAWNQLLKGAEGGSKRALNRLYQEAEPWIRQRANSMGVTATARDDLFARGCEAFVEAVNRMHKEPIRNARNYLMRCINGQMLSLRQAYAEYAKPLISLEQAWYEEGSNKFATLIKTLKDKKFGPDPTARAFIKELLEKVKGMPKLKQEVFYGKVMGESSKEIGNRLGISQNYVDQTFKRVKAALGKFQNT